MSDRFEIRQDFLWRQDGQIFHFYIGDDPDPWADVDLRDWPGRLAFSLHGAAIWQRLTEGAQ